MGHDYSTAAFSCSGTPKKKLHSKKHKNTDCNVINERSVPYMKVC